MMGQYYNHLAQRSAYSMTMMSNSEWGPVAMMLEPNTVRSALPTVQVSLVYSGTILQGLADSPEQLARTISAPATR